MKIGVFDSGVGGEAVATRLRNIMPEYNFITANDHSNVPYGGRSADEIYELTSKAIRPLIQTGCKIIVLACNTVTVNAIKLLRVAYPDITFIGLEPMLKPAAELTKTGVVGILATPATFGSQRYQYLKQQYLSNFKVIEPDCSDWATEIEKDYGKTLDISPNISQIVNQNGDVIVIACTHYIWIKSKIEKIASPNVKVIEPSEAITRHLKIISSS